MRFVKVKSVTTGYMVWKFEMNAVNIVLQHEGRGTPAGLQGDISSEGGTIQIRILNDINGSISLNNTCLQRTRNLFTSRTGSSLPKNFANIIL